MLNLKAFMTPDMRAAVLDACSTDRFSGIIPVSEFDGCERVTVDPCPGTEKAAGKKKDDSH